MSVKNKNKYIIISIHVNDIMFSPSVQMLFFARNRNKRAYSFWDVLGDNLLNKISSNYGNGNQGQVNINPLFNGHAPADRCDALPPYVYAPPFPLAM